MKKLFLVTLSAALALPVAAGAGVIVRPFQPMAAPPDFALHLAQETKRAPRDLPHLVPPEPRPDHRPEPRPERSGEGLIEQGAKLFLRGIFEQLRPELEAADLPKQLEILKDLSGLLSEIDQFHAPEVLPNGDVLIRRKSPPEAKPPSEAGEIETGPNGEIDL